MGPRALQGLSGRKTEEAATGLVKIVVGVWGLSFLTAHLIFSVPLSKEHCLLWSQAHGTGRATPPISLTSTMRERKGSLQSGAGRYSVGRRGWCWRGSAICQTLKLFCRNSSVQRKETRRPSNGSGGPIHLWPDASPASRGSGWHARVLDSEALHLRPGHTVPGPRVHREYEEHQPSSLVPQPFCPQQGPYPRTHEYHRSTTAVAVCVRSPTTWGFFDTDGLVHLN